MHRDPWRKNKGLESGRAEAGGVQCFEKNCSNSGPHRSSVESVRSLPNRTRVGNIGDALGTSKFRGKSFAERCTQATSVCGPHSDGFRCPIRVAFAVALCISSGKFPVEGGATHGRGELFQNQRCRHVAVFVKIVAHRSFLVRINRARSGHVAVLGRSGVAQC